MVIVLQRRTAGVVKSARSLNDPKLYPVDHNARPCFVSLLGLLRVVCAGCAPFSAGSMYPSAKGAPSARADPYHCPCSTRGAKLNYVSHLARCCDTAAVDCRASMASHHVDYYAICSLTIIIHIIIYSWEIAASCGSAIRWPGLPLHSSKRDVSSSSWSARRVISPQINVVDRCRWPHVFIEGGYNP